MTYHRHNGDVKITWTPSDSDLAREAAKSVVGDSDIEVSSQQASDIQAEYERLHVERYGSKSKYQ